ncbi:MAG: hypothetical protein HY889_06745 [Deltaproteobacteria bacterium]|nr:hypothetical protein [Deltaproteobacteria bacterium]
MQRAEEYLRAADILHKNGLFAPSISSAYFSSLHASLAAFLISGSGQTPKENFNDFNVKLSKFSLKLDPFVGKVQEAKVARTGGADVDSTENEALLRLYQTREFFLEVKDFLRRTIRF